MKTSLERHLFAGFSLLCTANVICFFPDVLMGAAPVGIYHDYNIAHRITSSFSCVLWALLAQRLSSRALQGSFVGSHLLLLVGIAASVAKTPFSTVVAGCLCGMGLAVSMTCWLALLTFVKEKSQAAIQGWQVALSSGAVIFLTAVLREAVALAAMCSVAGSLVAFVRARRCLARNEMDPFSARVGRKSALVRNGLKEAFPPLVGYVLIAFLYGAISGITLGNEGSPFGLLAAMSGPLIAAVVFLVWLHFSRSRNYAAVAQCSLICIILLVPCAPVDLIASFLSFGFQICGLMLFSHCVDEFSAQPRVVVSVLAVAYGTAEAMFLVGLYLPGAFGITNYEMFPTGLSFSTTLVYVAFGALLVLFVRTFNAQRKEIEFLEKQLVQEAQEQTLLKAAMAESDGKKFDVACRVMAESYGLTKRETEIAALLARGRDIKFVCDELCLARNTVKGYTKRIYSKLDIHSKQELIDIIERPTE